MPEVNKEQLRIKIVEDFSTIAELLILAVSFIKFTILIR